MKISYKEIDEFSNNFRRLAKKYRSLPDDLELFKKVISEAPLGTGRHFAILYIQKNVKIIKARFFCKSLKGSSLRIVYAYCENEQCIEFIELYYKGDKKNEDRKRIKQYLKSFS